MDEQFRTWRSHGEVLTRLKWSHGAGLAYIRHKDITIRRDSPRPPEEDAVIAGPFDSLEAAKAALLVLE